MRHRSADLAAFNWSVPDTLLNSAWDMATGMAHHVPDTIPAGTHTALFSTSIDL